MSYPIPSVDLENVREFHVIDEWEYQEDFFTSIDRAVNMN